MRPSAARLLNILVPVKRFVFTHQLLSFSQIRARSAVDYAVKIRVNPQQTGVDLNVKHSMVRSSFLRVVSVATPIISSAESI